MSYQIDLLQSTKQQLRLSSFAFDDELNMYIEAAKARIIAAGVKAEKVNDTTDTMMVSAITSYAISQFGVDNPETNRYFRVFRNFMELFALMEGYRDG